MTLPIKCNQCRHWKPNRYTARGVCVLDYPPFDTSPYYGCGFGEVIGRIVDPKCEYCERINEQDRLQCLSCGAPLPEMKDRRANCFIPLRDYNYKEEYEPHPSPYFATGGVTLRATTSEAVWAIEVPPPTEERVL